MDDEAVNAYKFAGKRDECRSGLGHLQANVEYALSNKELAKPFRNYLGGLAKDHK